jgi:hypothetical protein
MWGSLSDERTSLLLTIAAGPRQRSHSRVRVLWDSRPYFTVSDSRLPFSSSPTTRRATVEVFDPASTQDSLPGQFWLRYIVSARISQEIQFPKISCVFMSPFYRDGCSIVAWTYVARVFTEPLLSNWSIRHNIFKINYICVILTHAYWFLDLSPNPY